MGFPFAPFLPRVSPVSAGQPQALSRRAHFLTDADIAVIPAGRWVLDVQHVFSTGLGLVWLGTAPAQMIAGFQAFTWSSQCTRRAFLAPCSDNHQKTGRSALSELHPAQRL